MMNDSGLSEQAGTNQPSWAKRFGAKLAIYFTALVSMSIVWAAGFLLDFDALLRALAEFSSHDSGQTTASLTDLAYLLEVCGWAAAIAHSAVRLTIRWCGFAWHEQASRFWGANISCGLTGMAAIGSLFAGCGHILEQGNYLAGAVHVAAGVVLMVVGLIENRSFKRKCGVGVPNPQQGATP
jgi:hypothetical protein